MSGVFEWVRHSAQVLIHRRLDLFVILVLSFVAGNFGGIGRNLLIGAVPPAALSDACYLMASIRAGTMR